MERFEIGEIATLICDRSTTPEAELLSYDGMDCLITTPLGQQPTWDVHGRANFTPGYIIRFADGFTCVAEPHELRKKRPPTTDEAECRQAMLDCIERAKRGCEVPA